jgi:hypothetical protein
VKRLIVLAAASLLACQSRGRAPLSEPLRAASAPASELSRPASAPSALLELFTSEGCSSCPSADENLAAITEEAAASAARVFTLELHVDYWNDLGWVDPFSAHAHSLRQNAYAKRFAASGMYTPQLLVNGREELVGSDRSRSRAAVERALRAPASALVTVLARRSASDVELEYRVDAPGAVDLQLVVADDTAETRVKRGENADRLLRHRHVVRAFQTLRVTPPSTGKATLRLPADSVGASFVVAYASDPLTLAVLGADAHTLSR